jgi:hypothetical protein
MCLDTSTDMRGSSVSKGEKPICWMVYNESGFKDHCKKYKEYKDWEKFRNPKRYESNLDKNYDSKNMMHCVRPLTMGIEIATTGKVNVDRTNIDRDFLLNIRLGNTSYEEIIEYADKKKRELIDAIEKCDFLPEVVDYEKVNELLINIRKY